MKNLKYFSIILFSISLLCSGCPDKEDECLTELFVQNNSSDAIFAFNCYDECMFTNETVYSERIGDKDSYTVNSGMSKKIACFTKTSSTVVDSLVLYIFLVDDLKNIEWDSILANKLYSKHVFYTADILYPKFLVEYP